MLADEVRQARILGRYGAFAEAAVGTGVTVDAIGFLGVVGYSAARFTSGLAGLGQPDWRGMARCLVWTLLIPALLAVAIGSIAYRVALWFLARRSVLPGSTIQAGADTLKGYVEPPTSRPKPLAKDPLLPPASNHRVRRLLSRELLQRRTDVTASRNLFLSSFSGDPWPERQHE
jgi:hypothetical protein